MTVKIRIQGNKRDIALIHAITEAGADAVIVHGRRWQDDYDVPSNIQHIAAIKRAVTLPIIANGDIHDVDSLQRLLAVSGCDAYMISRAGTGKPWLYQGLLQQRPIAAADKCFARCVTYFMQHIQGLTQLLQYEHQAVLL